MNEVDLNKIGTSSIYDQPPQTNENVYEIAAEMKKFILNRFIFCDSFFNM